MARGRLITIEGLDGAGKTTLAAELERALAGRVGAVRVLREPGGVELAERIRTLVTDPELRGGARAEARGANWASRRCARSTTSPPAGCSRTARCSCGSTPRPDGRGWRGAARRPT